MQFLKLTPLQIKPLKDLQKYRIAFSDFESMGVESDVFRCSAICYDAYHKVEKVEQKKCIKKRVIKFEKENIVKVFWNLEEYCEFLVKHFKCIYFFNISYDSNFIRNYFFKQEHGIIEREISSGNTILGIQFIRKSDKKVLFTIKDIYPFVLSSLENGCKEYNCKEQKFDVDFNNCNNLAIEKHVIQDVKMLYELAFVCRKHFYEISNCDIFDKKIYSAPSLSMKAFRTNFLYNKKGKRVELDNSCFLQKFIKGKKPEIKILQNIYEAIKKTYKGGYCNTETIELLYNTLSYDITSSYPNAMQHLLFPIGKAYRTLHFSEFMLRTRKIHGFCKVKLQLDKPLICGIRDNKLKKLKGIFIENITSIELQYALKMGAKVLKFFEGIYFKKYDKNHSLRKYAWKMFKLKANSKGARKLVAKLFINSIYGKFGQYYIQKNKQYNYYYTKEEYEFHKNDNGVIRTIDFNNGGITITTKDNISVKSFMFITWASLISAYARCYLLSQAYNTKSNYEDTDSIKIQEENLKYAKNIEEKELSRYYKENPEHLLGKWTYEYKLMKFRSLAPKIYAGIYDNEYRDKEVCKKCKYCFDIEGCESKFVKCKGVPKKEAIKLFHSIIEGKESFNTNEYIHIMKPNESLFIKKDLICKTDIFGGIRKMQKHLTPKRKIEEILTEF